MRRFIVTVLLTLGLTFNMVASSAAITDGTLDGNDHPAVVLLLMEIDGAPAYRCSGTMIAPTFLLTAGHCAGAPGEFSGMRVFYDSDVEAGRYGVTNNYPLGGLNSVEAVRWAAHPLYPSAPFYFHDVGMVELEEPVPGLDSSDYGTLPSVNAFDAFKTQRGLQKVWFTAVGYGLQAINPVFVEGSRTRMVAYPNLIQINVPGFTGDFSMLLSNNASTGGTCFGDSGGANFLRGTSTVAGITSFGINGNCAGTGGVFRTDRQNVQDFIAAFMAA